MYIRLVVELLVLALIAFVAIRLAVRFAVLRFTESPWRPPPRFHDGPVEPGWTEEVGRAGHLTFGRTSQVNDDAMLLDNGPPP